MKFSKYSLSLAAAVMVAASGCTSTKEQEKAPQIGEIAPIQLNAVIAQGRTLGEALLKAYKLNDYKAAEKINIGDGKTKFTKDRFDRLVKVFEQHGGIAEYMYMGDLNMKPVRRLFWRVSFKGSVSFPAAADKDMLFEVRIAMLNNECKIIGFGLLPI
jgi:hypothetical protein